MITVMDLPVSFATYEKYMLVELGVFEQNIWVENYLHSA